MKNRNLVAVFFLTFLTFGIYNIVWHVKTKNELNSLGAEIPTAWLLIVPFVNIWWLWKYSEGVGKVTNEKVSTILAFVLLFLLNIVGMLILQYEYNNLDSQPAVAAAQPAGTPAPGFGGPEAPAATTAPAAETPAVPAGEPAAPVSATTPTDSTDQTTQPPQAPQV